MRMQGGHEALSPVQTNPQLKHFPSVQHNEPFPQAQISKQKNIPLSLASIQQSPVSPQRFLKQGSLSPQSSLMQSVSPKTLAQQIGAEEESGTDLEKVDEDAVFDAKV